MWFAVHFTRTTWMVAMLSKILPTVLIVIDVAAAIVYACDGDIKRCVYWLSAATLTATVTY